MLTSHFPLPVVIVQHMPPLFTQMLAERLAKLCAVPVMEGASGMVKFDHMDLRGNLRSLGSFDIILCRNVLIYFDTETKRQIVTETRELLSANGVLVLGCAESIINIHNGFQRRLVGQSNIYSL